MALRAGDVLIWHPNPSNPYFRTVSEGPADSGKAGILLPIRSRSWTGKSYTCKMWNDIKGICTPSGLRRDSIYDEQELDRLLALGLKPKRDILHCMSENKRLSGWPIFHGCSKNALRRSLKAINALEFAEID